MSNVISLPTLDERNWKAIAEQIRIECFRLGMPAGAANWICDDMKPRWISVGGRFSEPLADAAQMQEWLRRLTDFVQSTLSKIMVQMLILEFELWKAKHPHYFDDDA